MRSRKKKNRIKRYDVTKKEEKVMIEFALLIVDRL
jgi:hypothetical protein